MLKEKNILYKHPLIVLLLFCITVRTTTFLLYGNIATTPDSEEYMYLAELLSSLNLAGYEGNRSPGYPLLLALTGNSLSRTVFIQLFAGIISIILAYSTMRLLMRDRWSFVLSLFMAAYVPWIFYDFAILTESVTLMFVMLVFYTFFKILNSENKTKADFIVLSLFCGYLVLIKPFYFFLPVLLFCFFLLKKHVFRHPALLSLLIIIPSFCFFGWSYVNRLNTGHFTSTTFYGYNIAQNCVDFAEKTTAEYSDIGNIYAKHRDEIRQREGNTAMAIWSAYPELKEETGLSFPDLSKRLYDYSVETIKLNPVSYLKQVFISWNNFWKGSIYLPNADFQIKENSETLYYTGLAEQKLLRFIKILFLLLIPFNVVFAFKKRELTPSLIISVVVLTASLAQAIVTFGSNSRFSYPFEIMIVISFALNIIDIIQLRKRSG